MLESYYIYDYTEFYGTSLNKAFRFSHGLIRVAIALFVLLGLNFLILVTMKKSIKNKIKLTRSNQNVFGDAPLTILSRTTSTIPRTGTAKSKSNRRSVGSSSARQAERNVTVMILVSGFNYLLGHIHGFVTYCVLIEPSVFKSCYASLTLYLFYVSYVTPLFIYFACNKLFRSYALGYIKKRRQVGDASSMLAERSRMPRIN
jgi:hypothetical protein